MMSAQGIEDIRDQGDRRDKCMYLDKGYCTNPFCPQEYCSLFCDYWDDGNQNLRGRRSQILHNPLDNTNVAGAYEIVTNEIAQYILQCDDELLVSFAVYLISGGFWGVRRSLDMQIILEPHFFHRDADEHGGMINIVMEPDPERYWKNKGIPDVLKYFKENIYKIADVYDTLITDDEKMKDMFCKRACVLREI